MAHTDFRQSLRLHRKYSQENSALDKCQGVKRGQTRTQSLQLKHLLQDYFCNSQSFLEPPGNLFDTKGFRYAQGISFLTQSLLFLVLQKHFWFFLEGRSI